ncbi:MAG: HEAT repeat domain-containing protein [Nitrososphaeria archaeon]|nr:HEAT repeat domain-containing protein [Nitrososphaeria archaeon]NDB62794.1 HEAT repeat domain-containing protein [Nitrosopumilaceae archaeon]NDB46406.1 HEAT repeat domain-containing protein [Nitrososphaeria archaeon]NDB91451.1 HEAT repeat domain-containing protein [Nitrososphaeria archaeon]NDF29209.1 HEAT repeat domain-containing protein [Nitrososphaeria archaeon]
MTIPENLQDIMQKGTKEEKIAALESTSSIADTRILETVISIFDDSDIELRGEAFSALLLNNNDISETVLRGLKSQSKNIRGYSALVLANRNERKAIPEIIQLTEDESAMVRSCAVGALGFLRASEAKSVIQKCIDDPNIEVKKSAIKSAIDIKDKSLLSKLDFLLQGTDPDIGKLIALARNNL